MGFFNSVECAFILLVVGALAAGLGRSWRVCGWTAAAFVAGSAAAALSAALPVVVRGAPVQSPIVRLPGFGSELAVSLDPLGAAFLILVTGVSLAATYYSIGYMGLYGRESPGRFYALLLLFIAGMVGLVSVSDWLFFIVFWELMTLASYFLVTFESSDPRAVRAGFKYFLMTHAATAGLLAAAVVLWRVTGSFSFESHSSGLTGVSGPLRAGLLALYLIAFATKAGIFPFGDWLPDAHPAAPSGVSAILSGVMIKLGAYGVLRVFWGWISEHGSQAEALIWGVIIAALGVLSAFVGGVTAMRENDAKRLLAFSSISQMGYIFLAVGIGVAFSGPGGSPTLALLGLLGAGFHILNDALYKALLFMNAGSVVYSAGTRDLNRVGGLWPVMPAAAAAGLVGVLSLAGLPPTNGFASKWVIYQSAVSGGLDYAPFAAAAVAAFFVSLSTLAYSLKYFATVFLGSLSIPSGDPRPLPKTMSQSQVILAVLCLLAGISPFWVMNLTCSVFGYGLAEAFDTGRAGGLAAVGSGGIPAFWSPVVMVGAFAACFAAAELIRRSGRASVRPVPVWFGGEEHPADEVRFRASGLYSPFNRAFARVYPHLTVPRLPGLARLGSLLDLDGRVYGPLVRAGGVLVDRVSRSHIGVPQLYMAWQAVGMAAVLTILVLIVR